MFIIVIQILDENKSQRVVEKSPQHPKVQKSSFSLQNIHCLMTTSIDCRITDTSIDSLVCDESEEKYHYSSNCIATTETPANVNVQSNTGGSVPFRMKPVRVRVSNSARYDTAAPFHVHPISDSCLKQNKLEKDISNINYSNIDFLQSTDPWIRSSEVVKEDRSYVKDRSCVKEDRSCVKEDRNCADRADSQTKLFAVARGTQSLSEDLQSYRKFISGPSCRTISLPLPLRGTVPQNQHTTGIGGPESQNDSSILVSKVNDSKNDRRIVTCNATPIPLTSNEHRYKQIKDVDIKDDSFSHAMQSPWASLWAC